MIWRVRAWELAERLGEHDPLGGPHHIGLCGVVDRVGLLGGPTVDVTPLGAKVVDDPSLGDADEPPGQCSAGRIELISASPGTDEHVLCHFPRSVLVERLSADPVDQRTMCVW